MNEQYQIGNAQTIGSREVQSNYFSIVSNDAGELFAVLADGTIDHPNGRKAAIIAVEYCVEAFLQNSMYQQEGHTMLDIALRANKQIQEKIYIGKTPRLSLTMALLKKQELQYFNVGANKLYLYEGHRERIFTSNTNKPYTYARYELSPGNVLGALSPGAHTVTHPMERIKIIESKEKIYDKAQAVIELIKRKNLNNQLNATVLLIEPKK